MRYRLTILMLLAALCVSGHRADALTPPVERDLCRITGTVEELREVASPMPWHSDNAPKVTEVAVKIKSASVLEKRTEQDSSQCVMYEPGQTEWFKLCDEVKLQPGLRIVAAEGTTIGAGRYCIFDIEIIDH